MSGEQAKRVLEEIAAGLGVSFGTLEVQITNGVMVYVKATKALKPVELEGELAKA